jgi:IS30 family transposase
MHPRTVNRILQMRRAQWSIQQIARHVGETYGTVKRVLDEHGMISTCQQTPAQEQYREDVRQMMKPYQRCPGCGAKAQLTNGRCLACRMAQ